MAADSIFTKNVTEFKVEYTFQPHIIINSNNKHTLKDK
ncbi:hypothetical protein MettiDRAFT_0765 [Methanolobus tindarius DSM 2278]|jgi:hypothetical protein|uniref:Uncharacterized protein n=1 Tax=Methanolobus tindarius DSM 2278 TaxID=1090322 RepID=W9DQ22_METTI|nr:hypothetical protein MettiDRAFT_0765 [Methanolobus tindarius DSM 2278]